MVSKMNASLKFVNKLTERTHSLGEAIGNLLVDAFHLLALFAIGGAVAWSAVIEFIAMIDRGSANIDGILLLFIYLELGAMVGIYFKTKHMPLRFLIYVAMTALTRLLFSFINIEHDADFRILIVTGAILILGITVLIIRFGSNRFPTLKVKNPYDDD